MKTKILITSLLLLAIFAFTSSVQSAENNPLAAVTNAVEQAQQAVKQANSSLEKAQSLASDFGLLIAGKTNVISIINTSTNKPSTNSVSETLNDAVIGILNGVKGASGEIYQASKTAITKSIDFTMEQAPLVVREFLHWKISEAIIYMTLWSIPAFCLFYGARKLRLYALTDAVPVSDRYHSDRSDYAIIEWILRGIAIIVLLCVVGSYGTTITKIAVAPRVYLIEYVVNTIHNGHTPSQ